MKPNLTLCLVMMLAVASCGKKPEEANSNLMEKSYGPSTGEIYFNALKEINRSISENDLSALKRVIAANPDMDLNQILHDGDTFLIHAIRNDFRDIRDFLLEKGVNPNLSNINQETPLMVAVEKGQINTIQTLLDMGVNLEKKNYAGDTALHIAIKKADDGIALLLIKHGSSVTNTDGNNHNAFALAQIYNIPDSYELIKGILQIDSGTPDIASFRALLVHGDYFSLSNVLSNYPRIVQDYESINPLSILADAKDENAAVKSAILLLGHSANVNGPTDADQTPLIKATLSEKESLASLYLSSKANHQLLDASGKSALIHAVLLNNSKLVDLLLSYSAVEKYSFRKNGKKVTYSACSFARQVRKDLKTQKEKDENEKIKDSLNCGLLRWLF